MFKKIGNIFKRKEGGTALGNILRQGVKSIPIVGNLLGNGAMMITAEQQDLRDLTDSQYFEKYGKQKAGTLKDANKNLANDLIGRIAGAGFETATQVRDNNISMTNNTGSMQGGFTSRIMDTAKKNILAIVLGVGLVVTTIVLIFKKSKNKR